MCYRKNPDKTFRMQILNANFPENTEKVLQRNTVFDIVKNLILPKPQVSVFPW